MRKLNIYGRKISPELEKAYFEGYRHGQMLRNFRLQLPYFGGLHYKSFSWVVRNMSRSFEGTGLYRGHLVFILRVHQLNCFGIYSYNEVVHDFSYHSYSGKRARDKELIDYVISEGYVSVCDDPDNPKRKKYELTERGLDVVDIYTQLILAATENNFIKMLINLGSTSYTARNCMKLIHEENQQHSLNPMKLRTRDLERAWKRKKTKKKKK